MKIKLENIIKVPIEHEHPVGKMDIYCRTCGLPVVEDTIQVRLVCSECRHPVNESDKFCAFCGGSLSGAIKKTEHYFTGAVSNEYFEPIKSAINAKRIKL
jgi:predicted amidophosphoribosyltransferase